MKHLFKISMACLMVVMALTSCSDAEDGLVKVTHYVELTLNGDDVVMVAQGGSYEELGCVAIEGDNDVSDKVTITDDINTDELGVYTVTYSANNTDGYPSSITRTVVVYDPSSIDRDISGTYTVAPGSNRYWLSSQAVVNFSGQTVDVVYCAPGFYYISDYMGGYYDQRAGYGSDYAMAGYFKLNNDNTITSVTNYVPGWGDSADDIQASYDETTGNISLEVAYGGQMIFYITLSK